MPSVKAHAPSSESAVFAEFQQTSQLISTIAVNENPTESDDALAQLRQIFDKYLELPSLLDQHLGTMVSELAGAARSIMGTDQIDHFWQSPLPRILSALYGLSKVRGRKRVQKFLPHTVNDVEVVLETLEKLNQEQTPEPLLNTDGGPQLWESVYSMWSWMGILSLVPFDSTIIMDETKISKLISLGKKHLSQPGPSREMAAICLASWLSRPDLEEVQLVSFIDWSKNVLENYISNSRDIFVTMGTLQVLVTVLKVSTASRETMIKRMAQLRPVLLEISQRNAPNLILRKNLIKWWTRLGAAYLPPRVASWRYQRGRRSLKENLLQSSTRDNDKNAKAEQSIKVDASGSEIFLVPDEVEEAMGQIIGGLTDPSTIVRWSAAKGVGRITERLPEICAHDVIDALLELLDDTEKDNDWHGACLAFAELARRGLLLSHRLMEIIPKISKALHYDVPRRQTSVGAHVRDAACYTCWAIARAYSPAMLKPFVSQLSESVVLAFLFDREVNCRRAASAAFQEFVGRQGAQNFKHGLSILTVADYFSLGNRIDAYTTIALQIARFDEYRRPIINNLLYVKLRHWDKAIRTLSSKALGKIVYLDTEYIEYTAIPHLLENSLDSRNVQLRHGAVLGLAEIIHAFNGVKSSEKSIEALLSKATLTSIPEHVATIEKKRLYRGKGGEQMREAVCRLIECISITGIPLTVPQQVRLLDSLDACIPHPNEAIQEQAGKALCALMRFYFPVTSNGPSDRLQKRVVDKYVKQLKTSTNPAVTRGFALALGCLPAKLLAPSEKVLNLCLANLCKSSRPDAQVGSDKDAETRRNSLVALTRISTTVGLEVAPRINECIVPLNTKQVGHVFTALFCGLEDYNKEQRGDVGSMSRIVAMQGLVDMAILATRSRSCDQFFSADIATQLVGGILKQLAEKLDAVRSVAGKCLLRLLLQQNPQIPYIPQREKLLIALRSGTSFDREDINWADSATAFPLVMKVAQIETYFDFVISGLVISVGSLTQSVSKYAADVLVNWAKESTDKDIQRLGRGNKLNAF
eukprot:scaffold26469_cov142-Cylindrotheca_fusiformis.AAC.2